MANFTVSSPIQAALSMTGGTMTLQWDGGFAPYQVQSATNLAIPDWEDVGPPTDETSMVLLPGTASSFYRIVGN